MKKVFLDSDVILDALLKRPGFNIPSMNLITLIGNGRIAGVTSSVVFVNVNYFLDKFDKANKLRLSKGLRSILPIISVGAGIIDLALSSNFIDFEDAIQYYSAVEGECDFIITRNIKDYKQSTIPVLTAEQFLRTIL
ncbi:type II toxin-antitoxin system VapC family toxin [Mucilaginibacter sp.]|uniref:type II toxin-antitoxin system VapC family toxin n=1 Tax=Mucilaginibacter sp. TaxID=1882438 RepID=UPI0035BBF50E